MQRLRNVKPGYVKAENCKSYEMHQPTSEKANKAEKKTKICTTKKCKANNCDS